MNNLGFWSLLKFNKYSSIGSLAWFAKTKIYLFRVYIYTNPLVRQLSTCRNFGNPKFLHHWWSCQWWSQQTHTAHWRMAPWESACAFRWEATTYIKSSHIVTLGCLRQLTVCVQQVCVEVQSHNIINEQCKNLLKVDFTDVGALITYTCNIRLCICSSKL